MNNQPQIPAAVLESGLLNWVLQHWLLTILIVLAVLLLLFFVVIPWFFKLLRRGKNVAETAELKKDLMVWKNLASLVQGGSKGQAAKQQLSGQLKLIGILFRQGIDLLKEAHRKKYDLPWYAILGEPMSGKSTLLKNSDLELTCSASEEMADNGKKQSLPLRYWLAPQALVLDVAGRVFFDRWLEGSSAEWFYLLKLLARRHHKRPLDGIILTVPADALISDDEALTKQKASLIASELQQLLSRLGMILPVYMVITKMDMVLGFREYFAELDETMQHQVFGWSNPDPEGKFVSGPFGEYWDSTVRTLREGRCGLMLSPDVLNEKENSGSRLDVSGRLYLFPENFDGLRRNLEIYLKNIFGKDNWRGNDQSLFNGLFFTSAEDNGIVLSERFAALCGKKTEEAVLVSRRPADGRGFFIKSLLHSVIFPNRHTACFTARELMKRRIPLYLLCLLVAGAGCTWLFSALLKGNSFRERLEPMAEYYQNVGRMMARKDIAHSPLVAKNAQGQYILMSDAEMIGDSRYSRLQFFYDAKTKAQKRIDAPFGFKLAGLMSFGLNSDLGAAMRYYVFNQIQTEMVYLPVVNAVQDRVLANGKEPFDKTKREALFDFSEIVFSSSPDYVSGFTPVDAFLLYLFPGISMDTVTLLSSYDRKYDWSSADTAAKIIYNYRYTQAQKFWFDQFFKEWKKLTIYSETIYPQLRQIIRSGTDFERIQKELQSLSDTLPDQLSDSAKSLETWRRLLAEQKRNTEKIRTAVQQLSNNGELQTLMLPDQLAVQQKKEEEDGDSKQALKPINIMLRAIEDYEGRLTEDQKELNEYVHNIELLAVGRGGASFFKVEKGMSEAAFTAVRKNLKQEIGQLRTQSDELRKTRLFSLPENKQKKAILTDDVRMNYQVMEHFCDIAGRLGDVKPLKSLLDFPKAWISLDSRAQKIRADFDDCAKLYAEDPQMAKVIAANRRLFQRQLDYNRFLLAENLLNFYPESTAEFAGMISREAHEKTVLDISPRLAEESIGKVVFRKDYEPEAAKKYLQPFQLIAELARDEKQKKKQSLTSLLPRYPLVEKMIHDYMEGYLEYWGEYANSLEKLPPTWKDFRHFCARARAYQVNTLLFTAYKNSAALIQDVPDVLLSGELLKSRKTTLALLNDKLEILNTFFSETCTRMLSAWSTLPQSPDAAFSQLGGTPEKVLYSEYLPVLATGAKGDIPWWSKLVKQGAALVKKDAGTQLMEAFRKNEYNMLCFPLCADSLDSRVLTDEELGRIHSVLTTLGFTTDDKTAPAPKAAVKETASGAKEAVPVSFRSLDMARTMGVTERRWGHNFLMIIDALINREKPLVWNLALPDIVRQIKLTDSLHSKMPLASHRFRYLEVAVNGKVTGGRVQTDAAAALPLARGTVADRNVEFRFYTFSTDAAPSAVLCFPGEWSILRLYLAKGSYYDPESKQLYVPLTAVDKFSGKYIVWVSLKFNKLLPLPDQWPSTQNWPDFSSVQSTEKQKRIVSAQDWMKQFTKTSDYQSMVNLLRQYDLKTYPELEISLRENKGALSPFFLKYRYLELVVSGQKGKRVSTTALSPQLLGRIRLTEPKLEFCFYEHSGDTVPAERIVVNGPYAPLRLFAVKNRKILKSSVEADYDVRTEKANASIPLVLKLVK